MLRGWSHAVAVVPAVAGAVVLAVGHGYNTTERAALTLYGIALVALFSVSALYHCGHWTPRLRAVWRRIDHANIFLVIAATYTAVGVTLLDGAARAGILIAVWTAAVAGMVVVIAPWNVPRAVTVTLYLATGWMAVVVIPALAQRVGATELALLLGGGALYSLGAVGYAVQRPRLWPRVFGYHEVFHLLVIAATALFYAFVVLTAAPATRL